MKKLLLMLSFLLAASIMHGQTNDTDDALFSKGTDDASLWEEKDCERMWELWNTKYYMSNFKLSMCYKCEGEMLDRELNAVYRQVKKDRAHDKEFINHLIQSQREWLKVRRSFYDLKFVDSGDWGRESYIVCGGQFWLAFLENRIQFLKLMTISKFVEGDYCSGT